jgi:prepilin-type processing-associated H-X9-DG protein
MTTAEVVVVAMVAAYLALLAMPAVQSGGESHWRISCPLHLRTLAMALKAYHQDHGCFPPAYLTDDSGKPIHSWRALILPYLDGADELQKQYHFDEPWNGPENIGVALGKRRGRAYYCGGDPCAQNADPTTTSYFAVIGRNTAWRGSTSVKISDLPDNGRNTILLVEAANCGIDWKEPKDLTFEQAAAGINRQPGPSISSSHTLRDDYFHHAQKGAYVAFADGHAGSLPESISPAKLKSLLTGDLAEPVDVDELQKAALNWSNILALVILVVSVLVLVFGSLAQRGSIPRRNTD